MIAPHPVTAPTFPAGPVGVNFGPGAAEDRADELYDQGREAIEDGRYDRAVDRFNRLIEMKTNRTDAALSKRVRVAFEVPRASGPRIVYVLAPVGGAPTPAARALLAELRSARAARVYERHGFVVLAAH